jgi:hypothetical protein
MVALVFETAEHNQMLAAAGMARLSRRLFQFDGLEANLARSFPLADSAPHDIR